METLTGGELRRKRKGGEREKERERGRRGRRGVWRHYWRGIGEKEREREREESVVLASIVKCLFTFRSLIPTKVVYMCDIIRSSW